MKILTTNDLKLLVRGTSLLSTGGGGSVSDGMKLVSATTANPKLVDMDALAPNDTLLTIFGVGGRVSSDPVQSCKAALSAYKILFNIDPSAIIPVEIGPLSTLVPITIGTDLGIPIANADIVGNRAAPEVYLETISIPDLSRLPCVVANDKGDTIAITGARSIEQIEFIMRDFAIRSGGDAYVVGYPLVVSQIQNIVGKDSISDAITIGKALDNCSNNNVTIEQFCNKFDFTLLAKGTVIRQQTRIENGFTVGTMTITSTKSEKYKVYIKNENIVLTKNNHVVTTVPDLICVLDTQSYIGLSSYEQNKGRQVAILARKPAPIWYTKKGIQLFSPKTLKLPFSQKTLYNT